MTTKSNLGSPDATVVAPQTLPVLSGDAVVAARAAPTIAFYVEHRADPSAGFNGYTEIVHVTLDSGDAGGGPGEFEEFMRAALAEWYDGASVEPLAEAEARWAREEAATSEYEARIEREERDHLNSLPSPDDQPIPEEEWVHTRHSGARLP